MAGGRGIDIGIDFLRGEWQRVGEAQWGEALGVTNNALWYRVVVG